MNFYDVIFAQQKSKTDSKYFGEISDAINVLAGTETTYTPSEMGEAILSAIPTEEVTDDIVSVTDAAAYPAEGLEFAIEPVQDLHGYDKPWPAGGGKNLVDESMLLTATGWSKTNTGYYTGSISELNNTFGPSTDGFCPNTTFKANTQYTISVTNYVVSDGYINIRIYYTDKTTDGMQLSTNTTLTNSTFTTAANKTVQKITTGYMQSFTGQVAWKDFQVEEGTTATSYEPYANICPISGWTGVNGEKTGSNLCNGIAIQGGISTYTGELDPNLTNRISLVDMNVMAGKTYTFSSNQYVRCIYGYNSNGDPVQKIVDTPEGGAKNITFTVPQGCSKVGVSLMNSSGASAATSIVPSDLQNAMLNLGSTATTYEPYQGISIPITFPTEAGTVYGGKVDVINGKLLAYPEYDSYNGETLTGKWISSMDAYVEGTTPTIGAQVVDLSGVGTEYDITPQQVQMLLGDNNIWCDTGDTTLEYKVDLGRYIAKKQAAQVTPQLSLSRQDVSLDVDDEPAEEKEEAENLTAEKEIAEELAEIEKVKDIKEIEEHERNRANKI